MTTIQIETSTKSNFESRFNLFAKKVAKMGLEKPTFSYGDSYNRDKVICIKSEGEEFINTYIINVTDIHLNIENSYKLNGWELVSVVLFKEGVVLAIDLNTASPSQFGLDYTRCDHCGGNHAGRKKSFIVRNKSEFKQVGSTCSKEFLGMSERNITNMQVMFSELIESRFLDGSEDGEAYGNRMGRDTSYLAGYEGVEVSKILPLIFDNVVSDGYIKKEYLTTTEIDRFGNVDTVFARTMWGAKIQTNEKTATVNVVTNQYKEGVVSETSFADYIEYVKGLETKTRTETFYIKPERVNGKLDFTKLIEEGFFQSVEFYQGFDSSLKNVVKSNTHVLWFSYSEDQYDKLALYSQTGCICVLTYKSYEEEVVVEDFNYTLKQVLSNDLIRIKDISTIAAGYANYLKVLKNADKEFIGIVGEKVALSLNITEIKKGIGAFGEWTLYTLSDDNGNVFTKFGTINQKFSDSEEVKVGSVIKAKFEIKEHKEFNSIKQTVLGRLSKI